MKKKNLKKALLPYDKHKLTAVRNLSKQTKSEEEEKEQARKQHHKKWTMPDQRPGYIKSRKHDCL
jgi:hypothetical protein